MTSHVLHSFCSALTHSPFSFLMLPPPPRSTLFPYTTLFRSPCPGGALPLLIDQPEAWNRVVLDFLAKDRKSTRLNSSHRTISYAVFCLKKKKEHVAIDVDAVRAVQECEHLAGDETSARGGTG